MLGALLTIAAAVVIVGAAAKRLSKRDLGCPQCLYRFRTTRPEDAAIVPVETSQQPRVSGMGVAGSSDPDRKVTSKYDYYLGSRLW